MGLISATPTDAATVLVLPAGKRETWMLQGGRAMMPPAQLHGETDSRQRNNIYRTSEII